MLLLQCKYAWIKNYGDNSHFQIFVTHISTYVIHISIFLIIGKFTNSQTLKRHDWFIKRKELLVDFLQRAHYAIIFLTHRIQVESHGAERWIQGVLKFAVQRLHLRSREKLLNLQPSAESDNEELQKLFKLLSIMFNAHLTIQ